jgi:two-component system, OmpR family, response regulator
MKTKILLVEDDASMGYLVKEYLDMMGFEVTLVTEGGEAMPIFNKEVFQICLLDVMLPQKDGYSIATEIRAQDTNVPIIFLTAKAMKEDRLHGLRLGADDYITKPFSIEELHLRIEAVLKRTYALATRADAQHLIRFGNTVFDTANYTLDTEGGKTNLTYLEMKMLHLFCRNKNKVVERETILKEVWGDENVLVGRSIDVFISRLRKLLKDNPSVKFVNVHSIGYRMEID